MSLRDALTRLFPALAKLPSGCFVVGGAIRDLLLGRDPLDVDVACLDPLGAARSLHGRVIRLGDAKHLSAWRVVLRTADGDHVPDHRHDHVYDFAEILGGDIEIDLARRDFTVNAMALDLAGDALIDLHRGQDDLRRGIIRLVKASNFDDDPLRTLKGVRMAVKLSFVIDDDTIESIRLRAPRIVEMAAERVSYELSIILSAGRLRTAIDLLDRTGLAAPLGLRVRVLHADDVSLAGAYALLVDDPRAYAERWRWSDKLLGEVLTLQRLIERHDRIALYDAGESIARQLPAVLRAIGIDDEIDSPDFSIQALLTGTEIAEWTGLAPGAELGRIKRRLLEAQIRGEITTRKQAERFVTAIA
jgi:Poly A polymerase head domain/Probable RNA and SrmB- binding site of polymerase A